MQAAANALSLSFFVCISPQMFQLSGPLLQHQLSAHASAAAAAAAAAASTASAAATAAARLEWQKAVLEFE